MAQVGRDRVEHLELALGDARGRPSRSGASSREASSASRVLDARRAPRSRSGGDGRSSPRVAAASAGYVGGVGDLPDREPELGGDVVDILGAGVGRPGGATLAEARLRGLDHDGRRLAERDDRLRGGWRRASVRSPRAPSSALHAEVLVGLELVEAVEAESAALEQRRDGLPRASARCPSASIDVDEQEGLPERHRE